MNLKRIYFDADLWLSSQRISQMTLAEQGAYIRLLAYDISGDGIPDDDKRLAVLSQMGSDWDKNGPVKACFKAHPRRPGYLRNDKVEAEHARVAAWHERSSLGGKKSAEGRRGDSEWSNKAHAARWGNANQDAKCTSHDTTATQNAKCTSHEDQNANCNSHAASHKCEAGCEPGCEASKLNLTNNIYLSKTRAREDQNNKIKPIASHSHRINPGKRPSLSEVEFISDKIGLPINEARAYYNDMEAARWERLDGEPIGNWVRHITIHRDKWRERNEIAKIHGGLRTSEATANKRNAAMGLTADDERAAGQRAENIVKARMAHQAAQKSLAAQMAEP